ncbi:MAG TPA: RDD family protein [Candidatus Acidoferrales bacterium]|nr:RDD family protein [Candidatus Acidoferrales bacterium]
MKDPILSGRDSLRYPSERRAFIACIAAAPLTLGLVGIFLSGTIGNGAPSRLLLIAIGAMLYVSIARGKLLGDSVHIHPGQLPKVASLVAECSALLDVPAPQVFVRDDMQVPITAVGVAEPYALVISSHWLHHLRDEELRFLVTRELVHIRAGHTRLSSILSVNGRENPAVSLVFGAYLRRTEYTADRVALCYGGSIQDAVQAIAIASFHNLGRTIDLRAVAEQLRELRSEPTLRAGEWLGSSPYAARRIADLVRFAKTPLAERWTLTLSRARLDDEPAAPSRLPRPSVEAGSLRAYASAWRRAAAWCIDFGIILSIYPAFVHTAKSDVVIRTMSDAWHLLPPIVAAVTSGTVFFLWLYSVVLVTAVGRTVGMMIMDLRVVRADFGRASFWDVLARYTLAALSIVAIFPLVLWGLRRIQPYDRLSRTRLVSASARLEAQASLGA